MNTLELLAESIAADLDKQTDTVFLEKIKFDIKTYRSLFISRDLERNTIDNRLIQSFVMDLEEVDISLESGIDVGCKVLRTINEVPVPIKSKVTGSFIFVGDLDGEAHSFCKIQDWDLKNYSRFGSKKVYYDYFDNRIYIKNGGVREFLLIKDIFENPEDVVRCSSTSNTALLTEENYPMTLDLTARIKEVIITRLRNYQGEDKEVKIDKEE